MTRSHRDFLATHDTAIPEPDARLRIFISEYQRFRTERARRLRVLDVGCGKNPVLARHVDSGDEYWGCDFYDASDVAIDNYLRVDLNEESLLEKLEPGFDVIFCGRSSSICSAQMRSFGISENCSPQTGSSSCRPRISHIT